MTTTHGLSRLQKALLRAASKGWVTPAEAVECAAEEAREFGFFPRRWAASASRALRRLCNRGLLTFESRRYRGSTHTYRRTDWDGEIPFIPEAHAASADAAQAYRMDRAMANVDVNRLKEFMAMEAGA